jgi:hypothetical protein
MLPLCRYDRKKQFDKLYVRRQMNEVYPWHYLIITATAFGTGMIIFSVVLFRRLRTADSPTRKLCVNLSVTLVTLLIVLICAEVFFRFFVAQSDSFGFTLSQKNWDERYWHPINSLGYRDIEHTHNSLSGKKILFVVGDSFAAGAGIKLCKDRFSDCLQERLGNKWAVINIAVSGWATVQEQNAQLDYPFADPDVIIFSYYINDIEAACAAAGISRPLFIEPPSSIFKQLINSSYLLNYFYWRLYRFSDDRDLNKTYWRYINRCYADEKSWAIHKNELLQVCNYSKAYNKRLLVVVFPELTNIQGSRLITDKVAGFLKQQGVEVLDLALLLPGRETKELVVNNFNSHPSVLLHHEIADRLTEILISRNIDGFRPE